MFLGVASVVLACSGQKPPPDGLYVESPNGDITLSTSNGEALVKTIPFQVKSVFSIDNNNRQFRLHLETELQGQTGAGLKAHLVDGGTILTGTGSNDHAHSWFVFDVNLDIAKTFASKHKQRLRNRTNLAKRVEYQFSTSTARYRVGDQIPIRLDLWRKQGEAPVDVVIGGATRGPRNERFSFRVLRNNGTPLPILSAHNFGGIATAISLGQRGAPVTTTAQLQRWVSIHTPGRYIVECAYAGELVEPESFGSGYYEGDKYWSFSATGTLSIEVE
jgi:hypothetical protein